MRRQSPQKNRNEISLMIANLWLLIRILGVKPNKREGLVWRVGLNWNQVRIPGTSNQQDHSSRGSYTLWEQLNIVDLDILNRLARSFCFARNSVAKNARRKAKQVWLRVWTISDAFNDNSTRVLFQQGKNRSYKASRVVYTSTLKYIEYLNSIHVNYMQSVA